jgi:hypothetical protein
MLIKTLVPKMEIRAAQLYVSPRTRPLNQDEMQTRALSYLLKEPTCPQIGIDIAAREMAALIQGPCCLIPVPNHTGDTSANLRLCQAIAVCVEGGATVADVLGRSRVVESSCDRHKAGKPPLTIAEHFICRKVKKMVPANSIWFVDNTTTSGVTLEACKAEIGGFGRGLAFTDAWQSVCLQNARKAS